MTGDLSLFGIPDEEWGEVINSGYTIVASCQASNGLISDWCKFDGSATSASAVGVQICAVGMCEDSVFAYEAARVGLRLGLDACWGENADGQLGDGSTTQRTSPVQVGGLGPAIWIATGEAHSCAVLANGTAWCWGDNGKGQLGDGTKVRRTSPVLVTDPY